MDDGYASHPKVIALGEWEPFGVSLNDAALCWSSRHSTDGLVPDAVVPTLRSWSRGALLKRNVRALDVAEQLVAVGLWERVDGGYRIHDYLDYNPSREKVERIRAANRKRQTAWRGRQSGDAETERVSSAKCAQNVQTSYNRNSVSNAVTFGSPEHESPSNPSQETSAVTLLPSPTPYYKRQEQEETPPPASDSSKEREQNLPPKPLPNAALPACLNDYEVTPPPEFAHIGKHPLGVSLLRYAADRWPETFGESSARPEDVNAFHAAIVQGCWPDCPQTKPQREHCYLCVRDAVLDKRFDDKPWRKCHALFRHMVGNTTQKGDRPWVSD